MEVICKKADADKDTKLAFCSVDCKGCFIMIVNKIDFLERMFATLTYHQFFADLALIYLNPNEVMRLTAIFPEKKLKIFVTIT